MSIAIATKTTPSKEANPFSMDSFYKIAPAKKRLYYIISIVLLFCCLLLFWRKSTEAARRSECFSGEEFDFVMEHGISEATQDRWMNHNCALRPLSPSKYRFKEVTLQHCPCKRKIKEILGGTDDVALVTDTTCSREAHARGTGQKVRYSF